MSPCRNLQRILSGFCVSLCFGIPLSFAYLLHGICMCSYRPSFSCVFDLTLRDLLSTSAAAHTRTVVVSFASLK